MANGRNKSRKADPGRDGGGFVALPWAVLDAPAFQGLSHPARSLLLEIARQLGPSNNGTLLASGTYLAKRGWRSNDTVTRAKRELLEAGFIFETVMGHRPHKASWYAVTWMALDRNPKFDDGAFETFKRGAYRQNQPLKNAVLTPSRGVERPQIAPSHGVEGAAVAPSGGAIWGVLGGSPTPPDGDHLDKPSPATKNKEEGGLMTAQNTDQPAIETLTALWACVGARLPPWQFTRKPIAPQAKADHDQPRAIESFDELWQKVGRHVVHSPKLHQDRQPPADRLELARAAQQRAIERHARHAPVLAGAGAACRLDERDNNRIVDREFAHESWED